MSIQSVGDVDEMEYLDLFSLVDQINHLGKTSDRTQEPAANALGGDGILADITL